MAKYIDADAMKKFIEETNTDRELLVSSYIVDWIHWFIDEAPAADVVEVVRCKDCNHFMEFRPSQKAATKADGTCFLRVLYATDEKYQCVNENDFCSLAAKMDGGKDV